MKVSYKVTTDKGSASVMTAETQFEKHILTSIRGNSIEMEFRSHKHVSYEEVDEVSFMLTPENEKK